MQVFPGSFPWGTFARLPLDVYAEAWAAAVEIVEAREDAAREAARG